MKVLLISIVLVALLLVGVVIWMGLYAMPVPESVTEVQEGESEEDRWVGHTVNGVWSLGGI